MSFLTCISPYHRWPSVFVALSFGLHLSPAQATPTFEPVYGFEISPTNPQASVIRGSDGNLYGTTSKGGYGDIDGNSYGTVFKMTPGGTLTTLVSFNFANGSSPEAALVQGNDGNFYGTSAGGGSHSSGTVFKMTAGGTLTTLVNFTLVNGSRPIAALVQGNDENFYGTTTQGGSGGNGTVFKVTPEGTITTLVNFNNANGSSPESALVLGSEGNFYGTTVRGGSSNSGTVFKMTSSGTLTTLVHLTGSNGSRPTAALVEGGDGNFYGTTTTGGSFGNTYGSGYGTVFKMTPGGTLTTLVNFAEVNGSFPSGPLVRSGNGNFYGMTSRGGSYSDWSGGTYGTVFTVTPSGNLSTLVNFAGANGLWPTSSGLMDGGDGNYYGTTFGGGSSDKGTVFKMNANGSLTTLVSFTTAIASEPYTLVQGRDGNLYGTTRGGGIYRDPYGSAYGTVFKMTLNGTLTTLLNFDSTNGSFPDAGLIQGSDGSFYGTTEQGGNSGFGTFFRITPEGNLTTLIHFTGNDVRFSSAALTLGNDGSFYGPTLDGNIFMMTPAGIRTTFVAFTGAHGRFPSKVVLGNDGSFYGTTGQGGISNAGTLFKITPAGTLTTLGSLTGFNGSFRPSLLLQASDGDFYGTTATGGNSGDGTAFKITGNGVITTLVNFTGNNGFNPATSLIQSSDGNFYGTTKSGGSSDFGTVFQMTPGGVLRTLKHLTRENGRYPTAALVRGTDGNLYGTTRDGGMTSDNRPAGGGQIFRLRMGPSVMSLAQTSVSTSSATLNGTINPGGYATSVSFQYGTDPSLAIFSTVAMGTLPAGTTDLSVQATISGIESGSIYNFRVVASNAENTLPQLGSILSFTTQGARSAYSIWAATQFSSGQFFNTLVSGPVADPDNDGVVNLLECAFNLNPLTSGNPVLIAGSGTFGLPLIRRTESPPRFSIQFLRRKTSTNPGVTYLPQFSSGLDEPWSAFTGIETVQSIDATWERVTAEESAGLQQKRFGRVKVVSGQ